VQVCVRQPGKPSPDLSLDDSETDRRFPTESRRRAEDILIETKATYHIQLFSGVQHGFATKGDPTVENSRTWAFIEKSTIINSSGNL
jgi:dienelactone hydrolase